MKLKWKENTRTRIMILLCAIFLFGVQWFGSALARDKKIDDAKHAAVVSEAGEAVKSNKIARALQDYDEVSTLCMSAIAVYSCAILGYIYFDRRERNEKQ